MGMRRRSERRLAEELSRQVAEAEGAAARWRRALDEVGEGVVICDEAGEEVFRNRAADRHLRTRLSDILAAGAVTEALAAARRGGRPERMLELRSPVRRDLRIRAAPLGDGLGAVALVDDVSERQRLDTIRRDFVANVSHELKTPVGALSLLAETLDGEEDLEVVGRLAGRVAAEVDRLGRIIDDLLDLSRIEADEDSHRELVALHLVVEEALDPLRPLARSQDITLQVGVVPPDVTLLADRQDLVSAVANLVDNAIKYSDPGAVVQVAVETGAEEVAIVVADQGIGIPGRDLQRIFERFYRVDKARSRVTGGTGLGLAIVRHVATNHGGTVEVRSREGEGSTFTLRLPRPPLNGTSDGAPVAGGGDGG